MYYILVSTVIGLFIAMLFVNIYFRVKVMKAYKHLVQNDVEFGAAHMFDKEKMAKEIYPKYPDQVKHIETFVDHIQYSIKMASVLIFLVTVFGGILMWYRYDY